MSSKSVVVLMGFLVAVSLSVFLFLLSPTPVNAANTYYVSPTGDDSKTGSSTAPWKTIQKAANTMVAGDTVIVLPGTYSERVTVTKSGSSGAPITFRAQYPVVTNQINQSNQSTSKGFKITANYITVQGFEIANADYVRWHSDVSSGVYIEGTNVIVENNYIHDCPLDGITLYGLPLTNPQYNAARLATNCTIKNNKLFRNGMVGIDVSGRNNLIEGNEVWGTIQCPPSLMAVEDTKSDNNGKTCPFYDAVRGLDSDGMRFFDQGHIFRKNYIHDIHFGPPGINPAIGDYVDNSHIDCFQTWTGTYTETAKDILFEQNFCDNAQGQSSNETGQGFMIEGLVGQKGAIKVTSLVVRNNIIRAYRGINAIDTANMQIYNNIFIGNPSLSSEYHPGAVGFSNAVYPIVKNNIFYNQKNDSLSHTITIANSSANGTYNTYRETDIDYNAFYTDNSTSPCVKVNDYVCRPKTVNEIWNTIPLFVNPAEDVFRLKKDSPLIDKGIGLGSLVPNDYDGIGRPQGTGYDIGAFEYSPQLTTPTPSSVPCLNRNLGNLSCDPQNLVNETDLGILLDKWDTPEGDLSGDNLTDVTDLSILLANWKTQ